MKSYLNKWDRLLEKIVSLLNISNTNPSSGLNGHVFVSDDSYSTASFCKIAAWDGATATVDYTVTQKNGTTINHSDVDLQNGGEPIVGIITNLEVTDGAIIAYYSLDYR